MGIFMASPHPNPPPRWGEGVSLSLFPSSIPVVPGHPCLTGVMRRANFMFVEFALSYGYRRLTATLEDEHLESVISPPRFNRVNEEETIVRALTHPIASRPLPDFLAGAHRVTVVIPDKTRKGRIAIVLPTILRYLDDAGIGRDRVRVLFANGSHAAQAEEEKASVMGWHNYRSLTVCEHDARDGTAVHCGTTKFGTPVALHPWVAEADRTIALGPIVHHYFAGFGGGPKMLMPGAAGYESIVTNHRRTLTPEGAFHPFCADGILEGNPVAEDIADAVRFFPPTFYVGTVHDSVGRIVDAVAGDILKAHRAGTEKVAALYEVALKDGADLAVAGAGGYPKDINFIQSHKAIHHASLAVRDGGVILAAAECRDGIGSTTLLTWFGMPLEEMKSKLFEEYTLHGHTALSLRMKERRVAILLVSSLPGEVVKSMGMIPVGTVEEGMSVARSILKNTYKAVILTDGSLSVPRLLHGG